MNIRLFVYLLFLPLFFALHTRALACEDNIPPPIILFVDSSEKLKNEDGSITRTGYVLEQAQSYLNAKEIPFEITFDSWSRILRNSQNSANSLILGLIRTPERENKYHWVQSLIVSSLSLYARKGVDVSNLGKEAIADKGYMAACEDSSAQCKMLADVGFSPEEILIVPESYNGALEKMLIRGRVDFIVSDQDEISANLKALDYDKDEIILVRELSNVIVYLAGSKNNFSAFYLEKFK